MLKTININTAAMSMKSFSDFIFLCYGTNIIDDLECILLYYSQSREIYLYQKYEQYELEKFD